MKQKQKDVEVISVCGNSYPRHDEPKNVWLDADSNATRFHQSFPDAVPRAIADVPGIRITSSHVFITDPDWRDNYYDRSWRDRQPSMAILGIGNVDEKHRLIHLCGPAYDEEFPSKSLATLRTDAPLFRNVDELLWKGPAPAFAAWAEKIGDAKLLGRASKFGA